MALHGGALPDFPWDSLIPIRERAARHPDGAVDLTIGTPVDPVPGGVRDALCAASDSPGYPPTIGTPALREAIYDWCARRRGAATRDGLGVLPTIGSKETVALLPSLLGLGEGDVVAFPRVAYPTYDVGARLAGATPLPLDTASDPASWPADVSLIWLNSPGNPDGHVLDLAQLRRIVAWARDRGAVLASDECYAELTWSVPEAPSLLDERVNGGRYAGLLSLYSLSKQSNLAGYRAAFIAGDARLIAPLTEVRKHSGFLMPAPVQAAMTWALGDEAHVAAQKGLYRSRRERLLGVLDRAGLVDDPLSQAGLYIWAAHARGTASGWDIVEACADLGIVVAPGDFYGPAGADRVRICLTATDEAVDEAVRRLPRLPGLLG
jgi:succinyldiaminopimelate transaminase